ncbi:MAG: LPS assembly lipoprotein LptE [Thalassobaculales bacterium]
MWWPSARQARARPAAVILLALALAGCGFRPLHQQGGGGDAAALRSIEVAPIPERLGQQLRNELDQRFVSAGQPAFRLEAGVRAQVSDLAIQKDESAIQSRVIVFASFVLKEAAGGREVTRGASRATVSYTRTPSQYANMVAEEDARRRALREIADDIRSRVAVALAARQRG